MDIKKLLVVIGFIVLVALVGFALYWVFFKQPNEERILQNYNGGTIPSGNEGNLNVVNDDNANNDQTLPWQEYLEDKVSPVAAGGLTQVTRITDSEVSGVISGIDGIQYYDEEAQQFYQIKMRE